MCARVMPVPFMATCINDPSLVCTLVAMDSSHRMREARNLALLGAAVATEAAALPL